MISYDIIEHGRPLQKVIKEAPKPTGTEVLVRITRSGVCHSDLHIWDGYFDLGDGKRFYVKDRGCVPPFTLGHEPFGIVEALGPKAKGAKVGQKRIVFPWIGCGKCAMCKDEQDNMCTAMRTIGVVRPGAYSSHLLVPHPKYLVDAAGVDESFAATLACSGVTAYSAYSKLPKLPAPFPFQNDPCACAQSSMRCRLWRSHSALRASTSAIAPTRCTAITARVFGVIAASTSAKSMHKVLASTSTMTGVALAASTTPAVATNVKPGTMTSSPSPTPQANRAASNVCVPLVTASPKRAV